MALDDGRQVLSAQCVRDVGYIQLETVGVAARRWALWRRLSGNLWRRIAAAAAVACRRAIRGGRRIVDGRAISGWWGAIAGLRSPCPRACAPRRQFFAPASKQAPDAYKQ